jgi:hypothetical protein
MICHYFLRAYTDHLHRNAESEMADQVSRFFRGNRFDELDLGPGLFCTDWSNEPRPAVFRGLERYEGAIREFCD